MTREEYFANLKSAEDALHYGVGHDKGGHSGRYPYGSGKTIKKSTVIKTPYYGYAGGKQPKKIYGKTFMTVDEKNRKKLEKSLIRNNKNRSDISKLMDPYQVRTMSYKAKKDMHLMTADQQVSLFKDILKNKPELKNMMLEDAKEWNKKNNIKQTNDLAKNLQSALSINQSKTSDIMSKAALNANYDGFMVNSKTKDIDRLTEALIIKPNKTLKRASKRTEFVSSAYDF